MNDYLAFDHLFDPVVVMNPKGSMVYFNNQASIFFKLPPRLLKQKDSLIQLCETTDLDLEDWLNKALLSYDVLISPEIRLSIPHAPELEYHVIIKLIPIQTSKGVTFAVVFHDMTVEKNLHHKYREQLEELKKTHAQILQADKLTTLGELTANISHEINNPLTIAAGHTEIMKTLLKSKDLSTKVASLQSANNIVEESLERVNQIIKNMKDFLHQSEDQKEYCDIDALVESATEWIQPTAKKASVTIKKEVKVARTVALANRVKLEQVIINLIKNSIDALSEAKVKDPAILIRVAKSDTTQQTFIDVIDNGPGLSPGMKANLFKPFSSTKDSGHGTGLGLSICAKIVESHKGKLEHVDSPKGCHFRMRLPLIEVYSYTRNDPSLSGSVTKSQKRVLVLDNEVQILNVLSSFVQEAGYVFIGSSDPRDALKFLDKADVDLIITDFNMPNMSGSVFSQTARKNGYEGPILYLTSAKFIEQFNKDKLELDISGLIIKPFNKDDVMTTIRMALKPKEGAA